MERTTVLRIAVPNKGALSEPAIAMLREAGYRVRRDGRELVVVDGENEVEFSPSTTTSSRPSRRTR